jgi:uncharacterized protein YraI
VLVLVKGRFTKYSVEIASGGMVYIPSFMTIGSGVQVIFRYCLHDLTGCSVGISEGWDLRNTL